MRKIFVFLLLALLFTSAFAEETHCLPIDSISLGDSVGDILWKLEQADIDYEIHRFTDPDDIIIYTALSAFGCQDSYPSSILYFDEHNGLEHISPPLPNADTLVEEYDALSKFLGNADIVSLPDYVDYDLGESYVEYSFPTYVVWVKDDAIYELEIDTSIYTTVQSSFLDGIEIEPDDSPRQYMGMTIYPPDFLEDLSYKYY